MCMGSLAIMTVKCVHDQHLGVLSMPNGGMHDSHHKRVPSAMSMDFHPIVDAFLIMYVLPANNLCHRMGREYSFLPHCLFYQKMAFESGCRVRSPVVFISNLLIQTEWCGPSVEEYPADRGAEHVCSGNSGLQAKSISPGHF
jgi:hypothetical protein